MRTIVFLVFASLLLASPAYAETTDQELKDLLQQLEKKVENVESQAERDAMAETLRRAIKDSEAQHPKRKKHKPKDHAKRVRDQNECIDLGLKVYEKAYTEPTALKKAVRQCDGHVDAKLLRLRFEVERQSYTDPTAFETAATFSKRPELQKKFGLIQLAFEAFRQGYTDRTALNQAADWVAALKRRDEGCIRRAHGIHSKYYTPTTALDRAVNTCK